MLEAGTEVIDFDPILEIRKCTASALFFIIKYVQIFSVKDSDWIPFRLWPAQIKAIRDIIKHGWVVAIKSRQVGFSWLIRALFLWVAMFHPVANIGMWSKSDADAKMLLSEEVGFLGMYKRLPDWMKSDITAKNEHRVVFENGTIVQCRPYTQAEGSTYSHAFIDEIDRFPHDTAEVLVRNLRPALEHAKMNLWGSISDKDRPDSLLKNTFRAAQKGEGDFFPIFIPWHAPPHRDQEWYDKQYAAALAEFRDPLEAKEWMAQQFPATPEEAMAPSSISKRIPADAVMQCYKPVDPVDIWGDSWGEDSEDWDEDDELPSSDDLIIYHMPDPDMDYVIGADPSGGDGGDEAAAQVIEAPTGRHMATYASRYAEPVEQFPRDLHQLAVFYNHASVLVERNNHGGSTIASLEDIAMEEDSGVSLILGPDGKPGYLQTKDNRTAMWDRTAREIKSRRVTKLINKKTGLPVVITKVDIADAATAEQLIDIDKSTLAGSTNKLDDRAVAYALSVMARSLDAVYIDGDVMV